MGRGFQVYSQDPRSGGSGCFLLRTEGVREPVAYQMQHVFGVRVQFYLGKGEFLGNLMERGGVLQDGIGA